MRSIYIFSVFLIVLFGCELFTTRTPEEPNGGSGSGWQFPNSPEHVILNLENAFSIRSSLDYMRSFPTEEDSSYSYVPDQQTVNNKPAAFEGWGLRNEQAFSEALFSKSNLPLDSLVIVDFPIEQRTLLGDSATLSIQYSMHIGHVRSDLAREFEGRSELQLWRSEDGGWIVRRWEDYRTSDLPCLSDLKAEFK
ncbi:hypothetical protein ACFLQV_03520 [Calditrichota bacterium]